MDKDKQRRTGAFYTPRIWADEAHKYITNTFGEDWKDKYVVWDPAWGTGNLTRDYKFKELYCSTIEQSDIDTANQMNYNPEATKFQYDFLNDGIVDGQIDIINDPKLPQGLKDAILQGKEIIVFMNPPYQDGSELTTDGGDSELKNNIQTSINLLMIKDKWGRCSKQLYTQFLYTITECQKLNKNIIIGLFCPSTFLTGPSFKKFRGKYFEYFNYKKGFLFRASHFADVADNWGISFTIWNNKKNDNEFNVDILDVNEKNFNIEKQFVKNLYNSDDLIPASEWVRREIKGMEIFDTPKLSSALNVKKTDKGNMVNNSLGYFYNHSNNVNLNAQSVVMFSSGFSQGQGLSVIPENYYKVISLFTARKCVNKTWINWQDEYISPNEWHPYYQQFQYDSIIYSLFNSKSQQSSLRQVEYKDTLWDIKNNFFWMSREEMKEINK